MDPADPALGGSSAGNRSCVRTWSRGGVDAADPAGRDIVSGSDAWFSRDTGPGGGSLARHRRKVVPIELGRDRVLTPPGRWLEGRLVETQRATRGEEGPVAHHRPFIAPRRRRHGQPWRRQARCHGPDLRQEGGGDDKSGGVASYRVQKVFVYSRKQVADHSEDLFDQDFHPRRLVLVTCTTGTARSTRATSSFSPSRRNIRRRGPRRVPAPDEAGCPGRLRDRR